MEFVFVLTWSRNYVECCIHVFSDLLSWVVEDCCEEAIQNSHYRDADCSLLWRASWIYVLLLHHTGSQNKSSICPRFSESFLPGICRESISSALDLLEQNQEGGKSIPDSLLTNLFVIFSGVSAILKAYEQQDEECQENCKFHFL